MNKLSEFKRKGPPNIATIHCQNCNIEFSIPAYITWRRYCDRICAKEAIEKKKGVDTFTR